MISSVGERAPIFTLSGTGKCTISSVEMAGVPFVLYFYPKDATEGCTREAVEFRELIPAFDEIGVRVFGISPDSIDSHERFAQKHGLNFPLLADTDHRVANAYGLWVEKQMYGREFWGVQRATLLIGADGAVSHAWPKVRPKGHAEAVLARCRLSRSI